MAVAVTGDVAVEANQALTVTLASPSGVALGRSTGTGTILNRSIPVYDLVRDAVYTATDSDPLVIPEQAIVVPGSRAVSHAAGAKWGLSLQAAVIVKYRDAKTDARVQLEDLLR